MDKKITVVYAQPGRMAEIKEIEASLSSYQDLVSGCIEEFCPFDDDVAIICNEEGKFNGMFPNRAVQDKGEILDIIFGPLFVVKLGDEDYESLSIEQQSYYKDLFLYPETFLKNGTKIMALKYNPDVL